MTRRRRADHGRPGPSAGIRGPRHALRGCLHPRSRRVRDPGRRLTDTGQAAQTRGVLLLDIVGGVNQPTRRRRSRTRATGRTNRSSATGRRRCGRLDRRQHHSAARRHRRDGRRTTRRYATRPRTPTHRPNDPLLGSVATPSQRAVVKYFWVVSALILVQILLGVVTAHYGVEGSAFYGIPTRGDPALLDRPHLARAAGHLLDCHGVARRGPVYRARGERRRTAVAAPRRQRALRGAAHRRRRIDRRAVAERQADPRNRNGVVLPRTQRLRIHRSRTAVADRAPGGPVPLARAHGAGDPPRARSNPASSGRC